MSRPVRVALAGLGAIGNQHLDALHVIDGVELTAVVDESAQRARQVADRTGAATAATELDQVLARDDVDAVILATPTPLHVDQAAAVLGAGKHVLVEIPVADSWAGAELVVSTAKATERVCMVGHTRRYNPSHRWIHHRVRAGDLVVQQLAVHSYFLRRTNINALGQPRSWTDHLLWHHAAHTVDLLRFQTGEEITDANVLAGPTHPDLGIPMDMSIQLRTSGRTLCTLSLSFNNDGPLGSVFRYICDNGTYLARYDELVTGQDEPVDLSSAGVPANGVEGQDRDFVRAIQRNEPPVASLDAVLPSYRVLADLATQLEPAAS